jgi:secreted trypsin-like serine protease
MFNADNMSFFTGLATAQGNVFCGATLVTDRHLITAAHCVKPSLSTAMIGRRDTGPCLPPQCESIAVEAYVTHPMYSGEYTLHNDIALLRLARSVLYARPISLAALSSLHNATSYLIAGMGATSEAGTYPDQLQMAVVPAVSSVLCAQSAIGSYLNSGMLCAGTLSVP